MANAKTGSKMIRRCKIAIAKTKTMFKAKKKPDEQAEKRPDIPVTTAASISESVDKTRMLLLQKTGGKKENREGDKNALEVEKREVGEESKIIADTFVCVNIERSYDSGFEELKEIPPKNDTHIELHNDRSKQADKVEPNKDNNSKKGPNVNKPDNVAVKEREKHLDRFENGPDVSVDLDSDVLRSTNEMTIDEKDESIVDRLNNLTLRESEDKERRKKVIYVPRGPVRSKEAKLPAAPYPLQVPARACSEIVNNKIYSGGVVSVQTDYTETSSPCGEASQVEVDMCMEEVCNALSKENIDSIISMYNEVAILLPHNCLDPELTKDNYLTAEQTLGTAHATDIVNMTPEQDFENSPPIENSYLTADPNLTTGHIIDNAYTEELNFEVGHDIDNVVTVHQKFENIHNSVYTDQAFSGYYPESSVPDTKNMSLNVDISSMEQQFYKSPCYSHGLGDILTPPSSNDSHVSSPTCSVYAVHSPSSEADQPGLPDSFYPRLSSQEVLPVDKKKKSTYNMPYFKKEMQKLTEHYKSQECCGEGPRGVAALAAALQRCGVASRRELALRINNMPLDKLFSLLYQAVLPALSARAGDVDLALVLLAGQRLLAERPQLLLDPDYGLALLSRAAVRCPGCPDVTRFLAWCVRRAGDDPGKRGQPIYTQTDAQGDTLLGALVRLGDSHAASLAALVSAGERPLFSVDHRNNDGYTALHVACRVHDARAGPSTTHCAHVLLAHAGADLDWRDHKSGDTPLHLAVDAAGCDLRLLLTLFLAVPGDARRRRAYCANHSQKTPIMLARSALRARADYPPQVVEFLQKCRT